MNSYALRRVTNLPELRADWESHVWAKLPALAIDHFHPRSSDHHPQTHARMCVTDTALHVIFRVKDRYVKSIAVNYQDMVCRDSCVELFLQPKAEKGYFNFEFNCGGVMLLYYIEDHTRVGESFARYQEVSPEHAKLLQIRSTLPRVNPVEIPGPIEWRLEVAIAFCAIEPYIGAISPANPQRWRGNLYKCASATDHPHWASWSNLGDTLNFHQPDKFGEFVLE